MLVVRAGGAQRGVEDGGGHGGTLRTRVPSETNVIARALLVTAAADGVGHLELARRLPVEFRGRAVGDVLFRIVVQPLGGRERIGGADGGERFAGGEAGAGGGGLIGGAEIHGGKGPVHAGEDVVVVKRERVTKSLGHGVGPGGFEVGAPAGHAGVADAGAGAEGEGFVVGREERVVSEAGAARLEGGAADHVYGAADRVGAVFRCAEEADLDARDVGRGGAHHLEIAVAVAGAERGGGGGGGGQAVEADLGVDGVETAHADADDVISKILHADAGEPFHEFAGIGIGERAELIGGDDALLAETDALLVDGDGGGIGFFLRLHGERVHFDGGVGFAVAGLTGEGDVALRGLAGGDGEGDFLIVEPGEAHAQRGGAGGYTGEAEGATLIGEGDQLGALEGDAGVIEVVAGDGVFHPALDRAGGGGGSLRAGAECEDEREARGESKAEEGTESRHG